MDPRELILLFKELTKTSQTLIQEHIKEIPTNSLLDMYRKTRASNDVNFSLQKKYIEAKEAVKELMEILI